MKTASSASASQQILLITDIFPPQIGGPATFIAQLAETLGRQPGCRVSVVCASETPREAKDDERPYRLHRLQRRDSYFYKLAVRQRLAYEIAVHRRILVNGLEAAVYPIARLLGRRYLLKVVGDPVWEQARNTGRTTLDIDRFQTDAAARQAFGGLMATRNRRVGYAQRVVTPSRYLAQLVGGWGVPPGRIVTIPNGVDESRFTAPPPARAAGPLRVLFVGRLTNWKGVETLLLALPHVPNTRATIVGDGPELPQLVALARQLPLGARVEFAGRLSAAEVERQLQVAHVLVLTSLYEGLSHTLLEALATGVPCIASNRGGNREVIQPDKNGFLIEAQDVAALAEALRRIEADEGLRRRLAEGARATGRDFPLARTVQAYLDLLTGAAEQ